MSQPINNSDNLFPLQPLTAEDVEAFLTCFPKYLMNPITGNERGLIRDIIAVCKPMTNLEPDFPCGVKMRGK